MYSFALSQNVAVQSISLLACHWCWEDGSYSEAIYDMLLASFGKLDHALNERPYLDMLLHITAISDSLTQQRFVRLTHGNGQHSKGLIALLLHIRHTQPRKTWAGVTLLLALARQLPSFATHLGMTRSDWAWLDGWMKDHSSRGKPKGILAASNLSAAQPDEDREAVWQQYETLVKALGFRVELPLLHPPAIVVPGASCGVVSHHQLSRLVSAEEGGPGDGQQSSVGQSRHRRSSQIDTTAAYNSSSTVAHPHFAGVKQQRRPANRSSDSAQPSQRAAGQRSVDMPKLVAGQPSLARRFVNTSSARSRHDSEDELGSEDSDDADRLHEDRAAEYGLASPQKQHPPQQSHNDDDDNDIYERNGPASSYDHGEGADDDDDDDDGDDDELTTGLSGAASPAASNDGRRRRSEAYNISPTSSPQHRTSSLTFDPNTTPPSNTVRHPSNSTAAASSGLGHNKRRAPTTPVGLGSGGRAKGKAAPNSPASVGRSTRDGGGWTVRRDSEDGGGGGSGSGSGGGGGGGGAGSEIACTTCTFLNPSHARVCEMCETSLP